MKSGMKHHLVIICEFNGKLNCFVFEFTVENFLSLTFIALHMEEKMLALCDSNFCSKVKFLLLHKVNEFQFLPNEYKDS